ncbi:MAG: tetratricopeptide repeat protein [Halobacteriota archaeon]
MVAISPFYYIDKYGKHGADINTADDFEEMIKAKKDLEIKVIRLDNPIRDKDDAKIQGKKVGAHLVIYGETKSKIGERGEIKCSILPLSSLEAIPSEIPLLDVRTEEGYGVITTEKVTFAGVAEEPIVSLIQNISSSIYTIGAFDKYKKSNFTSAITFFTSVKDYENDSLILFYIGNCYYFNNNLNDSTQYFDKGIEIDPEYAAAWNNKGCALRDLGRYEEAIAACDKAIEIDPQLAAAWNNKGGTLRDLGRYEEAIAAYDKAVEIDPQLALAWYNKGFALHEVVGRYEEAIAAYDKAIEIDPQLADVWNNKGFALRDLGRSEGTRVAFKKAHEIDPTIEIPTYMYLKI